MDNKQISNILKKIKPCKIRALLQNIQVQDGYFYFTNLDVFVKVKHVNKTDSKLDCFVDYKMFNKTNSIEQSTVSNIDKGLVNKKVIEEDAGPTQTQVFSFGKRDYILSANQKMNEVALYASLSKA